MTARQRSLALLLGFITALAVLYVIRDKLVFDFNAAAMGKFTSALYGDSEGKGRVHCNGIDISPCVAAYNKDGRPPAWMLVGNSQLHGINRYSPGDKSAPMMLHDQLRPQGIYLVTNSLPNATIAEFVTLVHGVGRDYDLRKVIIPVVFNGMRGGSVREGQWSLLQEPETRRRLEKSFTARYMAPIVARANAARSEPQKNLSEVVEDRLNATVADIWPLWDARNDLRGLAKYAYHVGLHKIFGATAQSKRTLMGSGYEAQMQLLGNLLDDLRAAGISALVYVPPYRQDVPGPYIPEEYSRFKKALGDLARSKGADFVVLDDIVPGSEWGMVRDYLFGTDDYDFMHFTTVGHRRLAGALYEHLTSASRQAGED